MRDVNDPATGHLSADTAADLDEGLLDPDVAAVARAHVSACASCAALLAQLAELRRDLRADDPGPLPPAVADRLDAALSDSARDAGDAPSPAASPRAPGSVRRSGVRHSGVSRSWVSRSWVRPALSLAAGVVALAALVGGLRTLSDHGVGASSGSSAASGGSVGSSANPGAAAAGGSPAGRGSSASGGIASRGPLTAAAPSAGPAAPLASSGTAYATSDAALLRQARALLRREDLAVAARAGGSRFHDPTCVQALPGPAPVLVDQGRYAGRAALLVVQRTHGGLIATVLPRPCTAEDAARPLQVATGALPS